MESIHVTESNGKSAIWQEKERESERVREWETEKYLIKRAYQIY